MRCLARHPEDRYPGRDGRRRGARAARVGGLAQRRGSGGSDAHARPSSAACSSPPFLARWSSVEERRGSNWARSRRPRPRPPPIAARPAVAVLGFRNLAGREDVQWLSTALSEMLTTELGGGGEGAHGARRERQPDEDRARRSPTPMPTTPKRSRAFAATSAPISSCRARTSRSARAMAQRCASTSAFRTRRRGRRCRSVSETGKSSELLAVVSRAGGTAARAARHRRRARRDGIAPRLAAELAGRRPLLCRRPDASAPIRRARRARAARAGDSGRSEFPARALGAGDDVVGAWLRQQGQGGGHAGVQASAAISRAPIKLQVEGTFHEMSSEWKEAIGIWQTLATFFPDDVEYALRLANAQIVSGAREGRACDDRRFQEAVSSAIRILVSIWPRRRRPKRCRTSSACRRPRLPPARPARRRGRHCWSPARGFAKADAHAAIGPASTGGTRWSRRRVRIYAKAGDQAGVARSLNSLAGDFRWPGHQADDGALRRGAARSRGRSASRIWSRGF